MKNHVKTTLTPNTNGDIPADGYLLKDFPLYTDVKVAEEQAAMRLSSAPARFKRVCWKSPDGSIKCLPPL